MPDVHIFNDVRNIYIYIKVFKAVLRERRRSGGDAVIVALKTAHVTRKGQAEAEAEASALMYESQKYFNFIYL